MSDTEQKTVRVLVKRDFNNAGTEQQFTAGEEHDVTQGDYVNYRAAGLVERAADDTAAVGTAS